MGENLDFWFSVAFALKGGSRERQNDNEDLDQIL